MFRPEIQALRALAVTAVILFHLWPGAVPGGYVGVDVFFVISGYLITAHLLREVEQTGRIDLGRFWARRVRRLLPAAVLVLAVTLAATLALLPDTSWQRIVVEIAAAATYSLNWVLASNAVDYFAAENAATAVQHYWSLSVEEQFYIVWPLLVLGLVAAAARRGASVRRSLVVGVTTVGLLSLGYSVWYSASTPAAAYFSTFTHAWEFTAGALVALAGTTATLRSRGARVAGSWLGFAVIVACCFAFSGATVFPGWVALVPVAAVVLVVVAGDTTGMPLSPAPLLAARPVQLLGDASYSAYLWHWPLIVIAPFALARELDRTDRLTLLALTLVLAVVTKRYVEDPARRSPAFALRRRRAFAFAAAGALVVVAGCAVPWVVVDRRTEAAVELAEAAIADVPSAEQQCFGAAAALSGAECANLHTIDDGMVLATQPVAAVEPTSNIGGRLDVSEYGDPAASTTIALVGDSHAGHYLPAVAQIAADNGWRVWVIRNDSCSPSTATWTSTWADDMGAGCQQWRRDLLTYLPTNDDIDVVVTSSVAPRYGRTETEATQREAAQAFTAMWSAWIAGGKEVVVVADVPGPGEEIKEARDCIAANPGVVDPCTALRRVVLEKDAMVVAATQDPQDGLTLVDLTDAYCDADTCHTVVGGLVVYSGGAHISGLFSMSLIPFLQPELEAVVARG